MKVELCAPFDGINRMVPEGAIWAYQAILKAGRVTHEWSLKSKLGGIHIHAWQCEYGDGFIEWMGGIECHWPEAPEWGDADRPSHDHCWLLDGPCWHDGTSLGFSEQIAPYLPQDGRIDNGDHVRVTFELLHWYRDRLTPAPTSNDESPSTPERIDPCDACVGDGE